MGFIETNLTAGEKVIYRAKLHWIVYMWAAFFLLLGLHGCATGSEYTVGYFVFTSIAGILGYVRFVTSEFGVTDKRVLIKAGLIRRSSLETLLEKVEGIRVDQGVLGRALDYGTIVISGTGGTREVFHKIARPLEFRKQVQEQITAAQESK